MYNWFFQNEYNKIIGEHFDISDTGTRKCIIALEDAERSQLLSALTNSLYDKIVAKVDQIDFGTIPNSGGDITKVDGFDNTVECLNIMRQLVLEYKENPEIIDTVLNAIENIKSRKAQFVKAYTLNIEFPIILYNLIVMSIEQSVSFLISVCIQYIKDPASNTMKTALDKVAYNNAKDNLLYQQLYSFNTSCVSGELDETLNDVFKNGGKIREQFDPDEGTANTPFQQLDDEEPLDVNKFNIGTPDSQDIDFHGTQVIHDDEKNNCNSSSIEESIFDISGLGAAAKLFGNLGTTGKIVAGTAIAAGGLALSFKVIKFLFNCMIPILRSITYWCVNTRVKMSDCLATQAQFIEANAYKLQYSGSNDINPNVIKRQLKIADKLKVLSNKIAINNKKAEKEAEKMAKEESKKIKIKDLENELPSDIVSKSVLF